MKISIITVCYNAEKTIADAMESVLRQKPLQHVQMFECSNVRGVDRLEIEYVVVDGGSTDGTVALIRGFAERVRAFEHSNIQNIRTFSFHWLSEKDRGMYDAINKGIKMATGDVIGILNADDVLDGEVVLARIARLFDCSDCSIECLYGNVRFVKELGGKTLRVCFARWWKPWMLQWGYMPPHPAIFIRKECFEKWGGYEPDRKEYRIAADYELLIRFFRVHRMKARYMPICTTVMRTGGVSTKDVEARKKLNEEIVKANRVNGYFCCFPMLLPKYFVKIWEVILPRMGLMKG